MIYFLEEKNMYLDYLELSILQMRYEWKIERDKNLNLEFNIAKRVYLILTGS